MKEPNPFKVDDHMEEVPSHKPAFAWWVPYTLLELKRASRLCTLEPQRSGASTAYSVEIPRLTLKKPFTLDKEDEITSGMMRSITG